MTVFLQGVEGSLDFVRFVIIGGLRISGIIAVWFICNKNTSMGCHHGGIAFSGSHLMVIEIYIFSIVVNGSDLKVHFYIKVK